VDVRVISAELANRERMDAMSYKRPPGVQMLHDHLTRHVRQTAPVSALMPSFGDPEPEPLDDEHVLSRDVASAVQQRALELLEKGEMRISAAHALRAQEIIDRRQEKQRDRELLLVLARVLTKEQAPPPKYVGMAEKVEPLIIAGHAEEVVEQA
jgi:hypothetical protein